jgi:hypothetical protein
VRAVIHKAANGHERGRTRAKRGLKALDRGRPAGIGLILRASDKAAMSVSIKLACNRHDEGSLTRQFDADAVRQRTTPPPSMPPYDASSGFV